MQFAGSGRQYSLPLIGLLVSTLSVAADPLPQRPTFTGDWFGHGQYMREAGIDFRLEWSQFYQGMIQGELIAAGDAVFSELKNVCVWNKTNGGMGTFYRSKHEMVFVFKVGDAPHINTFGLGDGGRYRTNVWDYAGVNTMKKDRMDELTMHPTVKPVALVADAILDVTKRGALVLDPFGGSGSTLIAAEKTGRSARLIEFDPIYCDVIIKRFEAYTGKRAKLGVLA